MGRKRKKPTQVRVLKVKYRKANDIGKKTIIFPLKSCEQPPQTRGFAAEYRKPERMTSFKIKKIS